MENNWHNLDWKEAIRDFGSDSEKGLPEGEVWNRQKKFGKNLPPKEKPLSRLKIFFEQLKSPLIYILIIAGFITLFFREYSQAIVIFGAVFLNTIVGYFQENKASEALRALKKVVKVEAQAIREGNELKLDSSELVPGDIIVLTAGNKVPADGRLIEVHNLKVNEAPLTGEWLLAQKTTEILPEATPMADRDNMVYMGCMVEDGKGKAVVTSIGKDTEIGEVATLVKETKEEKTPLQKKIAKFSRTIGLVIGFICLFIFLGGILMQKDILEMFIISVAVAVAAIPEGLPVAMTVILALGMQRILKRKGLVRKLVAAETLGSTSITCTDKTLTLTQGKMEVSETVTLRSQISTQGKARWGDSFKKQLDKDQILLMTIATLANEAFVENPQDSYPLWRIRGRATDRALLVAGAEVGLKKQELEKIYPKIDEIPFNPQNKFIATFHQKEGKNIFFASGAPEKILSLSSYLQKDGKVRELDKNALSELNLQLENLTSKGQRVIAVAYKKYQTNLKYEKLEELCIGLVFVGFIGLKDPLRKEAKEAIQLCKKAGMRPIIVTGDHLLTARAIGKELGLRTKKENTIEGKDLNMMSEEEFQKKVKDIEIYARVEPHHKLRIIEAWQKRGEVVAMTGDGINDAPALKKADIGVALGSGTDVAKEVSDLVLLTDNFDIVVAAVEEGRVIIDNIRKTITLLVSQCFSEIILIGASIIGGLPLPILPAQILWENLIEGSPQGIALAFEPKEKGVMERKPEDPKRELITREMKTIILGFGILTDLILLGLFLWLLKMGLPLVEIRTIIFAALAIDTLFYSFSCKNLRKNIWQYNPFSNLYLIFGVFFGLLMLLLAIYLPLFQNLLKTVPLNPFDWLLLSGLGIINIILIEGTKYYFIARHKTEL